MKKFSIYLLSMLLIASVFSCAESSQQHKTVTKTPEVNITTVVNPADGLDLKLVGALLQKGNVKNASDLERELNKEGGINNLDLNSDNKVDFINVSENSSNGKNVKSFDLTTGKDDDLTFLATIEVEKGQDSYNINLSGSEQIYGNNAHYSSSHGLDMTDMLLLHWMFSSRPNYYHQPYYYGSYPSYYSQPRVVNHTTYVNRTVTQRTIANNNVKKSSTPYKSKVKSVNKNKISKKTRTSISNHNKAQKSFKTREKNKPVSKTGFTSKKNTTKSTSTKKKTISKPKKRTTRSRSTRSRSRSRRPSDGRFKVDVVSLDNPLEAIKQLNGVTYYWDRNLMETSTEFREFLADDCETEQQVGFIAQDVEKVFPLLIDNTHEYGKKVDYELMVVYLVEAMKQQQKMIESQQEQINLLTNNIK